MTPTQPSQAAEAAVERIMQLADNLETIKFVEGADGCDALVDDARENLERVVRAELARPLEVAPVKDAHSDDAAISAAMSEGNKHGVKSTTAARIVAAYLTSNRLPVASVAVGDKQTQEFIRAVEGPQNYQHAILDAFATPVPGGSGGDARLDTAFDDGWRLCAKWAVRGDLIDDMDSKPYLQGREICIAAILATPSPAGPAGTDAPADPYGY